MKKKLGRIWHNHNDWEEVKYNMYGCYNSVEKDELCERVIEFFNNEKMVKKYMRIVIDKFKNSCEHIFTNPSFNHIAWLGQASIAYRLLIPSDITRIAWNLLDEKTQEKANNIAKDEIKRWWSKFQKNF